MTFPRSLQGANNGCLHPSHCCRTRLLFISEKHKSPSWLGCGQTGFYMKRPGLECHPSCDSSEDLGSIPPTYLPWVSESGIRELCPVTSAVPLTTWSLPLPSIDQRQAASCYPAAAAPGAVVDITMLISRKDGLRLVSWSSGLSREFCWCSRRKRN